MLAGTFVFYSQWTIWKGLAVIVTVLMLCAWPLEWRSAWKESQLWRGAVVWVLWMLGCSLMTAGITGSQSWAWGAAGLLLWLLMLHQTGREARLTQWLGVAVVVAAAVSALFSIVQAGWFDPGWHWGMRLKNRLVYGGWNQVCSGVTYAHAAVWALGLAAGGEGPRWRRSLAAAAQVVLIFAALASLSRGALLVLLAGHGLALVLMSRAARTGVLRFALVLAAFHLVMPGLDNSSEPRPLETEVSRQYPPVIDGNPLREWTKRGSTGRLDMYEAVWQTMREGGAARQIFGTGLWSDAALWNARLPERERAPHPHSVFAATWLHGGWIGLAGLLAVLGMGAAAAWRAARQGWPLGLVLAGAGLAGVLFDGQSLASLDTLPRFEPLLVWTGLLLASGRNSSLDSSRPTG